MRKHLFVLCVLVPVSLLSLRQVQAQLLISEFLADNESSILDEDGDTSDWIEIYNGSAEPVDLAGWHLTDDPAELDKWSFPAGSLDAGGYLLVFASGKDRRTPGGELHTNFRLGAGGEFLALVRPDGRTVEHGFAPEYPEQKTDVSFGIGQDVQVDRLLERRAELRVLVPADDSLGASWRGGNEPFADGSWMRGPGGAGYVTTVPGFSVTNVKAAASVSDLSVAESVLATESLQAGTAAENAPFIDYLGTSGTGHYGTNRPFPGTTAGQEVDDFVIEARAIVTIPSAGAWTFGVMSDDGFGLDIEGHGQSFRIEYPSPRGPSDTLGVFNAGEAGDYSLRLVMYERGGGSGVELFAARGNLAAWNALDFRLVGNTGAGGLEVNSEVASSGSAGSYLSWIGTDVEDAMLGVNASAYVRIPFEVADPAAYESLTLRVRYDDGYAAFLNGVEVARRNAPTSLRFDSTATADRSNSLAQIQEDVNITEHLGLLRAGENILAVQALNEAAGDADLLLEVELAEIRIQSNVAGFFAAATPGAPNSGSLVDFVRDTRFSVDRGFHEQPFDLEITTLTPGATIRYTLDGSEPTETSGFVYNGPLRVEGTTVLRAAAFKEGFISTNVDTQTYLFLDDVVRQDAQATLDAGFPSMWGGTEPDYGLDPDVAGQDGQDLFGGKYAATLKDDLLSIPTISIVLPAVDMFGPSGIYTNSTSRGIAWERACSVELLMPDGSDGFQENCGIRIQGGAFRSHGLTKKHSFRLLFKAIYGDTKLRYPLFGEGGDIAGGFDTVTLRSNSNDGWQWNSAGARPLFIRDSFCRKTVLDMGSVASHGTFVHVYINGIYWGLYNPVERPDASFSASYFGGEKEEWDAISHRGVKDGSIEAWNTMLNLSAQGLASDADYEAIQGNNPDGSPNPALESYVDVDNMIDCMISNFYGGNTDWPHNNYWAARRRVDSTGFKFYIWDAEWTLGLGSDVNTNRTGVDNEFAAAYGAMRANAEFRQRFGDRVHRYFFHGGPLYVDPASPAWDPEHPERNVPAARFERLARTVERAVVAESARWGDQHVEVPYTRDEHWSVERANLLANYFPRRSGIVLAQFRGAGLYPRIDAPAFSRRGGYVDPGFELTVTAPLGTVYYTLDGSDPRLRGGEVSPSALEAGTTSGVTMVRAGDEAAVLVPADGSLGLDWTAPGFDDSAWAAGPTGVGYERGSGYEDLIGVDVGGEMYGQGTSVYIRVPFQVDDPSGVAFLHLNMKYDDGFAAYINGAPVAARNAPAVLSWDAAASQQNPDGAAVVFESIDISSHVGALRAGRNVLAIQGLNIGTSSSDLIILPELTGAAVAAGEGITLPAQRTLVRARALDGSDWSALEEGTFIPGEPPVLRVTEVMYHPLGPEADQSFGSDDFEFLEIQNIGSSAASLAGVSIRGGIEFDFDGSAVGSLAPGAFVVVVRDLQAFAARYDTSFISVAGEYAGRLGNGGDSIRVTDALSETIQEFSYLDSWYPQTDGAGYSLVINDPALAVEAWNDPASWHPGGELLGSPGRDDGGARSGWRLPGDANEDGRLDISDSVGLLLGLFAGQDLLPGCAGESPQAGGKLTVLDINGDAGVDISDAMYLLLFLFQGGPPPALGVECIPVEGCSSTCFP